MLSFRQLTGALWLLLRQLLPLAALVLADLSALHLLYRWNPERTDISKADVVERLVVDEQMKRLKTLTGFDIAFLGDSSCLMGIDPRILAKELSANVQSFCTIGYVGPAGYAAMLEAMIERNTAPHSLVLMIHSTSFRRSLSHDFWASLVEKEAAGLPKGHQLSFPKSAFDFAQFELIRRAVYSPLPGPYALYYGGAGDFRRVVAERNGSAIDPSTGLNASSLQAQKIVTPAPARDADFSTNEPFRDSLINLAGALKKLPTSTAVYLIFGPVPENVFSSAAAAARNKTLTEVAAALGIPHENILESPPTMFWSYMSGESHTNRWGQQVYSEKVAKLLSIRMER